MRGLSPVKEIFMIVFNEVIKQVEGINAEQLEYFIENHWVEPHGQRGNYYFAEIDVARVRLIRELRYQLLVEEDTLPLILSLLDQLYSTRRQLKALLRKMREATASREGGNDNEKISF